MYLEKNRPKFHRMFKKKNNMVISAHIATGQLAFVSSFPASVSLSIDSVTFQSNCFNSNTWENE